MTNARRGDAHGRPSSPPPGAGAAVPPCRVHYAALAATYAALVVYGSLVPLRYRAIAPAEAWARFRRLPYLELGIESRSDLVANILLFVPLGFLLMAAARCDRRGRPRDAVAALVVALACGLLSLAVEFTQTWFPPRTVSQNDVVAEVIGAAAGVALWGLAGRRLTALAREYAATAAPRRRPDLILGAYLAGFLLYSVLPLDLTISPADLWRKYRDGRVLAFGIAGSGPLEMAESVLSKVVAFVPIGLLASSRLGHSRSPAFNIGRGLVLGGLLSTAIEAAQLIVYSRVSNGADALWGALGVAGGAALPWGGSPAAGRGRVSRPGRSWAWLGAAGAYAALLVLVFWMPLRFTADRDLILARLRDLRRVPFEALYWGTDWNAMAQITAKVLWFAPLGALLARGLLADAPVGAGRRSRAVGALAACLVLATAIELGQVLLPVRVADLTDILLYAAGAALGLATMAGLLNAGADGLRGAARG